jgi:HTH-type transcriptional regulator/antitoxin HigA
MHPPLAIADEVAYANSMEIIDALTRLPKLSSNQAEYLNTLSILADAYENEHHPIDADAAGPLDVLRELMAARDMNASDLGRLLGERSLGPKVLNGQRELSKTHIRKLSDYFGVSAELFL